MARLQAAPLQKRWLGSLLGRDWKSRPYERSRRAVLGLPGRNVRAYARQNPAGGWPGSIVPWWCAGGRGARRYIVKFIVSENPRSSAFIRGRPW